MTDTDITHTIGQFLRNPLVWGYALLLVFFGMFVGQVNPLFFSLSQQADATTTSLYGQAAEMGQIGCLFATATIARRHIPTAARIASQTCNIGLVLGFSLTLIAPLSFTQGAPELQPIFITLAAITFGAGQGGCFLCWLLVFMQGGIDKTIPKMCASTVLSAAMLLILALPTSRAILFMLLAIVTTTCILLLRRCTNKEQVNPPPDNLSELAPGQRREFPPFSQIWGL